MAAFPVVRQSSARIAVMSDGGPDEGVEHVHIVSLPSLIASVVQFLRTGYPEGVPEHDYLPLFALLARKLTSEEVVQVADELAAHGDPTSANAVRQAIADLIHEQPLEADIARVSARLVAAGWQQQAPERTANHS
jgi:hypothetical protein